MQSTEKPKPVRDCTKLTTQQKDWIFSLYKKGKTTAEIMKITGITERKVQANMPPSVRVKRSNLVYAKG
jgi:hypothetical protein